MALHLFRAKIRFSLFGDSGYSHIFIPESTKIKKKNDSQSFCEI